MSGKLASPSPRRLHICRYLNPSRRISPLIACASLAVLDDTRPASGTSAYSASATQRPKYGATATIGDMGVSTRDACIVSHGQRKPDDKNIFVDDLQATLEAHRAANHAKRIHKVKVAPGTGLGIRNLKLPLSRNTSSFSAQQEIIVGATTSKLAGAEETISKSNTLVHGSIEEERDTDNPSGLPLEHRSPKTQSLDYKGRYRVVQDQWQPRQRSPFRSSRPIRFGYNEAVDSQPQLVIPKATDPPEEYEGERLWMSYIESDESDGTLR